jgi:hypothetical protein
MCIHIQLVRLTFKGKGCQRRWNEIDLTCTFLASQTQYYFLLPSSFFLIITISFCYTALLSTSDTIKPDGDSPELLPSCRVHILIII